MSKSLMEQSNPVCVIGPGRAGTSLTMRVLNLLGVDVGSVEGLVKHGPGGPKGFWERREIIRFNDRLLRSQGGSWRSPPPLPPGWEAAAELRPMREEARALLVRTFAGRPLWGWKDPRVSLTAPFWLRLVPNLRFVICLRNPIDAADSLAPPADSRQREAFYYSRRGFGGERAYRLWATYLSAALDNVADRPRLVVSYDEYFDELAGAVQRLARFIGREPPEPSSDVSREIEEFVDAGLRHYATSTEEALRDDRLPPEVVAVYRRAEALWAAPEEERSAAF